MLACLFIVANLDHLFTTVAGLTTFLLILIIHELGHQFVATRLGYRVVSVEIYPVHGVCRFDHPESKLDAARIAWGGVIGQMLLAVPLIVRLVLWGHSSSASLNAFLSIGGPTNFAVAILNLLPIRPLDGATAWSLLPMAWSAYRRKGRKREKSALEVFEELARKQKRR